MSTITITLKQALSVANRITYCTACDNIELTNNLPIPERAMGTTMELEFYHEFDTGNYEIVIITVSLDQEIVISTGEFKATKVLDVDGGEHWICFYIIRGLNEQDFVKN